MEETVSIGYVKCTQKDYSISFKLQVVAEVESEELSIYGLCVNMEYKVIVKFWLGSENMVHSIENTKFNEL